MLVRLLYASRAVDASSAALDQILDVSREHNLEHGVTGVLAYQGGVFLQVLEGGRGAVSSLFGSILRDPRHKDVELLLFEEIAARSFSGWALGVADVSRVNTSTVLRCSEQVTLNPYAVTGATSLALINELAAAAAVSCSSTHRT